MFPVGGNSWRVTSRRQQTVPARASPDEDVRSNDIAASIFCQAVLMLPSKYALIFLVISALDPHERSGTDSDGVAAL
jgi:hypothetical protein